MIEGKLVTAIDTLAGRGVGKTAIAREVGVAVNTLRRYEGWSQPHRAKPGEQPSREL